jgi:hypothetical protein
VVLVLAALWLTFATEHAVVIRHSAAAQTRPNAKMLDAKARPKPALDGKIVRLAGTPRVLEPPRDRDFGITFDTPLLVRRVSMFQWHEARADNKVTYRQDWLDHAVDSRRFKHPSGHANTQAFPFAGHKFLAPRVRLGHFKLAPAIVRALPAPVSAVTPSFRRLPVNLQASFQAHDGALTTSVDPEHPRLGDLRVRWLAAPLAPVTVLARVDGDRLVPAAQALGDPGLKVRQRPRASNDAVADLPLSPHAAWAWRVLALVLASLGAWLLVRRRRAGVSGIITAMGLAVGVLALLAGGVWFALSVWVAVVAWIIAALALAAVGSGLARRRAA